VETSVKASHPTNPKLQDDLLERTLRVWRPRLGRELSREAARQIVENAVGFFADLAAWSRAEMAAPANGAAGNAASDGAGACHDR
jgi:hypothetical protein